MTPHLVSTLCHKLQGWSDDPIPGQRKVYEAAVSARFPAHQLRGRWHYFDEDRVAILKGLGLRPKGQRPDCWSRADIGVGTEQTASAA